MAQLGFYINSAVCSGCKACELACKDVHNFEVGPRARRVREMCFGDWEQDAATGAWTPSKIGSYSVSFSCGHCDEPACVAACPTGAHAKDEETGLVVISKDDCIGCQACVKACPYGAPQYVEKENVTQKCDMCRGLTDLGEEPACVAICPQRALEVGDIEELRAKYGDASDVPPLPDSSATMPNVVIERHASVPADASSLHMMALYADDLDK